MTSMKVAVLRNELVFHAFKIKYNELHFLNRSVCHASIVLRHAVFKELAKCDLVFR